MKEDRIMLNIVDVFSGAGGLTEGFRSRDYYNFICHIEMDKDACSSLKLRNIYHYLKEQNNLSLYFEYIQGKISKNDLYSIVPSNITEDILNKEISEETIPSIFEFIDQRLGDKALDGIIGGPPCQAYSTIGRVSNKSKKLTDKRIYLYKHYVDFINKYKPKFFIFENVKGLLSFKDITGELLLPKIIDEFTKCGYRVDYKVINASDYGVVQKRERLILIGYRKDLSLNESFFDYLNEYVETPPTIKELFEDLPSIKAGRESNKYRGNYTSKFIGKYIRNKSDVLTQYIARPHNENDLQIYKLVLKAKKKGRNELINLINFGDLTVQVSTGENYILNVSDEKIICNVDTTDNTLEIISFNNLKSTQIIMYKEKNEENWKVLNISVKLNLNNEYEFKIINFKVNNVYE